MWGRVAGLCQWGLAGARLVAHIPGHWPAALPGRPRGRLVPPWNCRKHLQPKLVLLAPILVGERVWVPRCL